MLNWQIVKEYNLEIAERKGVKILKPSTTLWLWFTAVIISCAVSFYNSKIAINLILLISSILLIPRFIYVTWINDKSERFSKLFTEIFTSGVVQYILDLDDEDDKHKLLAIDSYFKEKLEQKLTSEEMDMYNYFTDGDFNKYYTLLKIFYINYTGLKMPEYALKKIVVSDKMKARLLIYQAKQKT